MNEAQYKISIHNLTLSNSSCSKVRSFAEIYLTLNDRFEPVTFIMVKVILTIMVKAILRIG